MRFVFLPFFVFGTLFSYHSFVSQKSLALLLPDKVIPTLLKEAFFTSHFMGYLALGLTGYFILLLMLAIIAVWLGRAINHCCSAIRPSFCRLCAAVLIFIFFISANTIFFPHSTAVIARQTTWLFFSLSLSIIAGIFSWYIFFLVSNKRFSLLLQLFIPLFLICWAALPAAAYLTEISFNWKDFPQKPTNSSELSSDLPHVILFGIDSLRPDYTSLNGRSTITPEVNKFLEKAVVFPETYTPIARTFPAWVSILTGKYPWEIGAPFNLTEVDPLALSDAFPHAFQEAGYRTLFVTDEKRFSNIDESFGFHDVAGPVMGAADFLLGSLNDTALANLFVNGPFGRWFFPFSHANRAAYVTYNPQTFLRLVSSWLPSNSERPHFAAVHLCLPHHPFLWQDAPVVENAPEENDKKELYELSLTAADAQFGNFLNMLKDKGYLNNAWVVLLSDHGEGLGEPITSMTDRLNTNGTLQGKDLVVSKDWGHGNSVLSAGQHRVMLAFRRYGEGEWQGGVSQQQAILADILPTLMDEIGIFPRVQDDENQRGISLFSAMHDQTFLVQRSLLFQTGLCPQMAISDGQIRSDDLQKGMNLYRINPQNGRLLLKPEMEVLHKATKSFGLRQEGKFLGMLSPDHAGNRQIVFKANPDEPLEFVEDQSSLPPDGQIMLQLLRRESEKF